MKDKKLNIYLIPLEKMENLYAGLFHGGEGAEPFIELVIIKSKPLLEYKATLFHELFHAFQHGYVQEKNRWLAEATADAIQDELLLTLSETPFYARFDDRYAFLRLWQRFEFDSLEGDHEYTSSIFFSYLIHEFKEGPYQGIDIIKELWKTQPKREDKIYLALEKILGGEENFKNVFHQFSVSLISGSEGKDPLSFPKPSISFLPLVQLVKVSEEVIPNKGYIEQFNTMSGEVLPKKFSLAPYSTKYIYFSWMRTDGIEDDLHISLPATPGQYLYTQAVVMEPDQTVAFYKGNHHPIQIPQFLNPRARKHVILVVSNPSPLKADGQLIAAYGSPPYLKKVKVLDSEKHRTIYEAQWQDASLKESINHLELENRKKVNLSFEVLFSKKIQSPKLTIEGKSYDLQEPKNEGAAGTSYKIEPVIIDIRELQKAIPLAFEGLDENENHLDSKPQTIPFLKGSTWAYYEGNQDQNHKIKIESAPPEGKTVLKGLIKDYAMKSVPNATVLGFVEYWQAPLEKIQQKQKLLEKKESGNWPENWNETQRALTELSMGLKEWGTHISGSSPQWRAQTDSEGKFEIQGLPTYDPQTMLDIKYNIVVFKDGFGGPDSPYYHGVNTGPEIDIKEPKTYFEFSLPQRVPTEWMSCSLKEESFSGAKLSDQALVQSGATISYNLYKQSITSDEIIRVKKYESFNYSWAPHLKAEYKQKYDETIQKAKSELHTANIIETLPLYYKTGEEPWADTLTIGYEFKPAISDTLVIKEICEPKSDLKTKAKGIALLRWIDPPFLKSMEYFERLSRTLHMWEGRTKDSTYPEE